MAFIQTYFEGKLSGELELPTQPITIGRGGECDIRIDNAGVSSFHAIVSPENGSWVIEDAASTNGLLINGERTHRHMLRYGDEVELFKHTLRYAEQSSGVNFASTSADVDRQGQSATFEVDVSQLGSLVTERQHQGVPHLDVVSRRAGQSEFPLSKVHVTIGKGKECDLRTGGWLAPRLAATLSRKADGYHLIPEGGAKMTVNGTEVDTPTCLSNGDSIQVVDLTLTFCEAA